MSLTMNVKSRLTADQASMELSLDAKEGATLAGYQGGLSRYSVRSDSDDLELERARLLERTLPSLLWWILVSDNAFQTPSRIRERRGLFGDLQQSGVMFVEDKTECKTAAPQGIFRRGVVALGEKPAHIDLLDKCPTAFMMGSSIDISLEAALHIWSSVPLYRSRVSPADAIVTLGVRFTVFCPTRYVLPDETAGILARPASEDSTDAA